MSGAAGRRAGDAASFEVLLGWLAEDRDRAGERYEAIRSKLVKIFACRGAAVPEELADATIDRVMSKLPEIGQRFVGQPEAYFYSVAQFIYFEHLRRRSPPPPPPPPPAEDREAEADCLERCLTRLASEDRELILAYYRDGERPRIECRRRLAEGLGIGLNALRLRLHRVRQGLRGCVTRCLERRGLGMEPAAARADRDHEPESRR